MKRNERDWAGQLVSWIKSAIEQQQTVFEDVTNDTGIKLSSGKTKFPDILLFLDKTSGVVFNGWELKFPDTAVDDVIMLENALEKAERLQSDSFVTWNGREAAIWGIDSENYSLNHLSKIKTYAASQGIATREDLSDPIKYAQNEPILKERAYEILHDLDVLYREGRLKPAIDISGNITKSIKDAAKIIIPQLQKAIVETKGTNPAFRRAFGKWKIYESATLQILQSSSRKQRRNLPEEVLAKFMFYNLIGKTLFYLTLCENLSGSLSPIAIEPGQKASEAMLLCFDKAKAIDFQAIFKPYFTDCIPFSDVVENALSQLLSILTGFDFKVLPSNVIGHILENLIPNDEKQSFGQYFTPELLAKLVAFPAVQSADDMLLDPTCGTGSFLGAFYSILKYHRRKMHSELLQQIWGNDISHFPAILSVITLYKQDVTQVDNFPRVTRDDFFNLKVGDTVDFPNPKDYAEHIGINIPEFDAIAGNFPFIQQEDIPNKELSTFFRKQFRNTQQAFIKGKAFSINERSDYFAYCVYYAERFLKQGGFLSAVTSNAWLGKEYGIQFKRFLLDNFHIKYIVRSNAEHWFKDSKVSTVFFVLEKTGNDLPTKFVTISQKLSELINASSEEDQIQQIEDFYGDIDNCEASYNKAWQQDAFSPNIYRRKDESATVCIVPKATLVGSLDSETNWTIYFRPTEIMNLLAPYLIQYEPSVFKVFRGERTGWNSMFVLNNKDVAATCIGEEYLVPYVKSSDEIKQIEISGNSTYKAFVCSTPRDQLDEGTGSWIDKFENALNKNGSLTVAQACKGHKPYWYSLRPKRAHIITSINPYTRFFFAYSHEPFVIDQRLIAMEVQEGRDVELIAALLNSAITFLTLELSGTARNLGVLDLNANYLKQLKILNPDLLNEQQKANILRAFQPLKERPIKSIFEETTFADRINFDQQILKAYGLDPKMLPEIYSLLATSVSDRISLKEK